MEKLINFLKDARLELRKVTWPTREETIRYTLIVLGLTFAVAIYLGALDFVFAFLLNRFVI